MTGSARKTGRRPKNSDNSQSDEITSAKNTSMRLTRDVEDDIDIKFQLHPRVSGQNRQYSIVRLKRQISSILRIKPTLLDTTLLDSPKIRSFFDQTTNFVKFRSRYNSKKFDSRKKSI